MTRPFRTALALPTALGAVVLGLVPFAVACGHPLRLGAPPSSSWSEPTTPVASGSLTLSGGTQSGDMGEITRFAGDVSRYSGDYYGSVASVRLDSEGRDWWVMSALQINGDLAIDFTPGVHRVYTSGVSSEPGDATSVDVMGCSGPSYGDYTFDNHASRVEVTVSTVSPTVRHLEFEATFGDQVTVGGFDYEVPSESGSTAPGI